MAIFPDDQRGFVLLINAENWMSGPAIRSLGWIMKSLVLGLDAPPVKKAPKVHTDLVILCVLLLGQVLGFAFSSRRIYRWRKYPETRPRKKRWILLTRGSLSILVGIAIAVGMLWWIPQSEDIPLSGLMLYAPDAGWLLFLNGTLALIGILADLYTWAWPGTGMTGAI
jgi:hypothetical protein